MRKKPHSKQTFRIDIELARLLEERAHARDVSRTEVVEAALMSLLQSDQDERMEAALARRLDRVSRQLDRLEWHRSEEHTSELQSLMRISYAVFCLKKKKINIPSL